MLWIITHRWRTDRRLTGFWSPLMSLAASSSSTNISINSAIMGSHGTSLKWYDLFFLFLPTPTSPASHPLTPAPLAQWSKQTEDGQSPLQRMNWKVRVFFVYFIWCIFCKGLWGFHTCLQTAVVFNWCQGTVHSTTPHSLFTKVNRKTVPGVFLVNSHTC